MRAIPVEPTPHNAPEGDAGPRPAAPATAATPAPPRAAANPPAAGQPAGPQPADTGRPAEVRSADADSTARPGDPPGTAGHVGEMAVDANGMDVARYQEVMSHHRPPDKG